MSFARRSRFATGSVRVASTVIIISTTISLIRVAIEMAVVGRNAMLHGALPLAVLISGGLLLSLIEWFGSRKETEAPSQQTNPTELKSAVVFGSLYAIVLFAVAATKAHFENTGLYVVAILSGLTDMDAITLSTSRMVCGWSTDSRHWLEGDRFRRDGKPCLQSRARGNARGSRLFARVAVLFGILIVAGGVLIAALP